MTCRDASDLIGACVRGDLEAVKRILAADPSLAAARDNFIGSTPLHFASHRGYDGIVAHLLAAGASVEARERASGTTPLHWAAEGGHAAVVRLLLEAGARLDPEDDWFALTPLGWATVVDWAPDFRDDRASASALLRAGGARPDLFSAVLADWEAVAEPIVAADLPALSRRLGFAADAMLPIHFAVAHDRLEAVAGLHDAGADPFAVTDSGLTPLAIALRDGRGTIEALLRGRGITEDLSAWIVSGDPGRARPLAAKSGRTGDLAAAGRYAGLLHHAAERGLASGVRLLLESGADANLRRRRLFGEITVETPALHLAAASGSVETASALIDAGAEVNAMSSGWGQTPLHRAAWEGDLPMIERLLSAGADPALRDSVHDATPGDWARASGKEVAALALAAAGGVNRR